MDVEGTCSLNINQFCYSNPTDCDGNLGASEPSAMDMNLSDGLTNIQADLPTPSPCPIGSGPSLCRRRQKIGRRRNGNLSCPVSSCFKQNLARVGLLDHM